MASTTTDLVPFLSLLILSTLALTLILLHEAPQIAAKLGEKGLSWPKNWLARAAIAFGLAAYLILAVTLFALIITTLLGLASAIANHDNAADLRWSGAFLAGLVTALSALIAFPFTVIRTLQAERQTYAREQDLVTDRINAAVTNLGAEKTVQRALHDVDGRPLADRGGAPVRWEETLPNMEVRIGALYALDRIARENLGFHVQIMQILCAYVRQNSPASGAKEPPEFINPPESAKADWDFGIAIYRQRLRDFTATLTKRDDIQIAMELIGRRSERQRRIEAAWHLDDIDDADPPFTRDHPPMPAEEATAEEWQAFRQAWDKWRNARSRYRGYRLDLRATNLQSLDFSELDLAGALLNDAQVQGADLERTQVQGAFLRDAQMQGADLWNAQMQEADLGYAIVDASTAFSVTDTSSVKLKEVVLETWRLSQDQVNAAFGDGSVTALPEGVTRPAHWPIQKLDWNDNEAEYRKWCADPDGYRRPD